MSPRSGSVRSSSSGPGWKPSTVRRQDFLESIPLRLARRSGRSVRGRAARGLRVILDIIANHTGDNWGYVAPDSDPGALRNEPPYLAYPQFYGAADGPGEGWSTALRDEHQQGSTAAGIHDGVWPTELRATRHYTRAGAGSLGAGDLDDARAEHKRTDFFARRIWRSTAARRCRPWSTATSTGSRSAIATASGSTRSSTCREDARTSAAPCASSRSHRQRNFLIVGEMAGGADAQDSSSITWPPPAAISPPPRHRRRAADPRRRGQGHATAADYSPPSTQRAAASSRTAPSAIATSRSSTTTITSSAASCVSRRRSPTPRRSRIGRSWRQPPSSSSRSASRASTTDPSRPSPDRRPVSCRSSPTRAGAAAIATCAKPCSGRPTRAPRTARISIGRFSNATRRCPASGHRHLARTPSTRRTRLPADCPHSARRGPASVLRTGRQYQRAARVFGDFALPAARMIAWSRILDTDEAVCRQPER